MTALNTNAPRAGGNMNGSFRELFQWYWGKAAISTTGGK